MTAKMPSIVVQGRDISNETYWNELSERMQFPDPFFQDRSLHDVLKEMRDITFHYAESNREGGLSRIRPGLKEIADDRFPVYNGTIEGDGRWLIADEVRMQFLKSIGFITVDPFDVHLEKIPVAEIGFLTTSIANAYLQPFSPFEI